LTISKDQMISTLRAAIDEELEVFHDAVIIELCIAQNFCVPSVVSDDEFRAIIIELTSFDPSIYEKYCDL